MPLCLWRAEAICCRSARWAEGPQPQGPATVTGMAKLSAGILVVRYLATEPQFLLVHPGGPFWARKDLGSWSIPKGEYGAGNDPLAEAVREFEEELGVAMPDGERFALGSITQAGGKIVTAWCVIGDIDLAAMASNTFELEWPPRSGTMRQFPEVDRAEFFSQPEAERRILASQHPFLQRALDAVNLAR